MKRSTLSKLALTLVAAFVFVGANAQVVNTDYSENATAAAGGITMHTTGKAVGLYAMPDLAYSPNYVTPGFVLNPTSTWAWTTAGLTQNANTGTPANYVEINGAAVGNYAISVVEGNTTTGCVDATPTTHTLVFLPAPTMAVNAGASAFGAVCGPINGHTVSFSLTAAPFATNAVFAQWSLKEYEVTIDGATGNAVVGAVPVATTVHQWNKFAASPQTIGAQSWSMVDGGGFNADGVAAPALSAHALSMTRDYTNTGGEIAYLYRWEISTADGDGISDRISRKSEYIAAGTGIYGTDGTIDIYIVNAPTTGPIYHIPNSFGN